ncbi:response regulator [uncultured Sunxiuqinia sp.]|uniref:GAF domain-containing hybrid sensor histidine kinase/response regulator n=1 Tax=uncultured Sunxiuqinia sp. TaxID=1573825 RepID=UPI00261DACA1|nr:response regulator [uncultured Sunxiuqinia sp.]
MTMANFSGLKLRNKLRLLSLFSILSLIVLGFISNFFYNTGKTLNLMINAERVHNNVFHEGIEDFYRYQISNDEALRNQAVAKMEAANQMARNFAAIEQLAQLPREAFVDTLFSCYREAYNDDRSNAVLMASRVKLLLALDSDKLDEAQQITRRGYELGEQIQKEVLAYRFNTDQATKAEITDDLAQMRGFYGDFAQAISSLNTMANNLLLAGILLIVLVLVVIVFAASEWISRSITKPVQEMVEKFGEIAKGDLTADLAIQANNEIGELANSFREIQNGFREVINYTKNVANGNYSTQIVPRSSKDELSQALNKMVDELREAQERTAKDSWFNAGINSINEKLRGNQQPDEISSKALTFLMEFLHSQLGSIHMYDPDYKFLTLLSSSGFDPQKLKSKIKLNEGIIGQVAASGERVILNDIPDESYLTYSSSGQFKPSQVVVIPLLFNEILIGTLELSSLTAYTSLELDFLQQASKILSIYLNLSENVLKTNELLQKTQDQASELQVQQEELRVANEELLEHTKVLTDNEKKLQVQQEELRVANEELEERTRQLELQKEDISLKNNELIETHDQLEAKAKELQLASQYKSEFLANMSHELRTPLNSLLILSSLLSANKKGNLTEDQVQSAKIIHKSGADLLHLINEVLDLSKIEAGKMTVDMDFVQTIDLKEEVLMSFKATAEDKKLAFEVLIEAGFPNEIRTDRHRLMQVLKNLLSNAFKFTSQGQVAVYFMGSCPQTQFRSAGLQPENTCCIQVSDSGVGIPAEKLEAIFEAFQQADGSISRKFGGTGLGLSISRELIRMLGGEIQLESQVGKGSVFYVYLPVHAGMDAISEPVKFAQPKVANIQEASETIPVSHPISDPILTPFIDDDRNDSLNGQTVLVIHPSKAQAEKFLQQARAKDFRVIAAANIPDGIILAEKFHPKAIMLAVEFANTADADYQKLKTHRLLGKLPVHVITPIDYNESEEQGELKTLETIEFADALKSLDSHFASPLKRMLIVEDNAVTRSVIKTMLFDLDLEISEVEMAHEAFDLLSRETFDCVILDLGLPDYSGKALLEKLKEHKIAIPKVIVYTGKEMSQEEVRELNAYTDTIILKGIKSDERLMDEVTLFLHQVSRQIPGKKTKPAITNEEALFKGKKIMVVDDDIRNVFALGQILEEREIEVVDAENGQVAIDLLQEDPQVDLILMDVMMPVMDGYQAMHIIRNTPKIKDIPIICLTAKAMKEDHENALKNGANDYLSKPLDEGKLFSMLKIWLYRN